MSDRLAHPAMPWLVLPLLLGACFFLGLGALPLFDVDEGAFSAASWEMLQRGDFITPWLYDEPRFDKPILIYWLQIASIHLFGIHEWAFRLPSAVAATLWVLAIFAFTWRWLDPSRALLASAIATTSAGVFLIGHAATADALLNLFFALALLDMFNYHQQRRSQILYRVYLWIALAVLTKGPVGIFIPLMVSFLFYLVERDLAAWLKAIFNPRGWLMLVVIALPWYVAEYLAQGQAFIDGFFLKHNIGRFTNTMEGHGGARYYYLIVVFLVVMPFAGLLLATLGHIKNFWRNSLNRFLLIWFLFVLAFFSFSHTQLPHYILYGCTPLFILMADRLKQRPNPWLLTLPAVVIALPLLFLPEIVAQAVTNTTDAFQQATLTLAQKNIAPTYRPFALLLVLNIATGLWLARRYPTGWTLVAGLGQALFLTGALLPVVANTQQVPVREAAAKARALDRPTVMWHAHLPSFEVYRQRITPRREPEPGELALSRVGHFDDLPHRVLYQKGGVALIERIQTP